MNFFTKNRILVGAVILLAAINIAILGTIGVHYLMVKELPPEQPQQPNHARFFAKELDLSPDQIQIFQDLRQEHTSQNQKIRIELRKKYKMMMEELGSQEPNQEHLDSLAVEIGLLHTNQQKGTIEHFLKVREICSPEQYEQLQHHFRKMMAREPMHRREPMQRNQRFERRRSIDKQNQ